MSADQTPMMPGSKRAKTRDDSADSTQPSPDRHKLSLLIRESGQPGGDLASQESGRDSSPRQTDAPVIDFTRQALGRYLGKSPEELRLARNSNGKPYLADEPGVEFNLSHCRRFEAIAISRCGAIGVDIETVRPRANMLAIARRSFHPDDLDYLRACAQDQRLDSFYALWVLKEAYVKCLGLRLFTAPRPGFARTGILGADDGGQPWRRLADEPGGALWLQLRRLPGNSLLALCLRAEEEDISKLVILQRHEP